MRLVVALVVFPKSIAFSLWASNCLMSGASSSLLRTFASVCALCNLKFRNRVVSCSWNFTNRRTVYTYGSSKSLHVSPSTTASSSFDGHPEYTRLIPCPSQPLRSRVEHMVVSDDSPVLKYICNALNLPPMYVVDLILFGAVQCALICPQPPSTATKEQIRIYMKVTEPSVLKRRKLLKGKTNREAHRVFRITHPDEFVEAGSYLRVQVHPKRFPRCYEIDWKSRIIHVADLYVVLNKPAGTPVGGTCENLEESCVTFVTRALRLIEPLKTTHQLDNCCEGCVVLARTKEYCSVFHKMIRDHMVQKFYVALVVAPMPTGLVTHYMRPAKAAPKLISEEFIQGWYLCQLEVLDCKKVPWPDSVTLEKYCVADSGWPLKEHAYECKINLLTGRTHQIRAQLAACGAPIIGDSMYIPATMAENEKPWLNPFRKNNKQLLSETEKNSAVEEWACLHGKEPSVAILLQACQISWGEKEVYKVRSPFWQ